MWSVCEFSKSPFAVTGFFFPLLGFLGQNAGGKKKNPAFCKPAKKSGLFPACF